MKKSKKIILSMAEATDKKAVGGKFAHQTKMATSGIPIPPFFCLSVAFYERLWAGIEQSVTQLIRDCNFENPPWARQLSQDIRALFDAMVVPKDLEKAIFEAFDRTFTRDTFISVRGSMVGRTEAESEDSADNPFAGMSDSFLFVKREQMMGRIKRVWSSGFSEEAMIYRHAQGMSLVGFGTAVGLQQMVSGERSFVLFTSDPKNANRDSIIVAGYGVGEGVVQERVPTDHYFVSFVNQEITTVLAKKDERLVLDHGAGHGLHSEKVPEELWNVPCLRDEEILALRDLGQKIEKLFGAPQDIEGCITEDGKIHILQARPIAIDYRRLRVWSNTNVTESFPGPTTALTYTFARYFYEVIFYDCYRMLGLKDRQLHDERLHLEKMIGFVQNRVYYSINAFYHLHSLCALFPIFRANWESMMGFRSSFVTKEAPFYSRISDFIRLSLSLAHGIAWAAYSYARHQHDLNRFFVWWDHLISPHRGKAFHGTDPMLAMIEFQKVWRQVSNKWGVTLTNDTYLPMFEGMVRGLFRRWGLVSDPSLLSDLLLGDDKLVSVEIILSAVELSERVQKDGTLSTQFATRTPKELVDDLKGGRLPEDFKKAFDRHMLRYGDRGLQELKLEQLSMRETPDVLMRMIQGYAKAGAQVASFRANEVRLRSAAEERLAVCLKHSPVKRAFLRSMLKRLRWLIRNRENSRYCRSELFGFSRAVFKGIARQFVRLDVIDHPDDIYHLTQDEIFGFIDGTGVTRNLRALIVIRKVEFEESRKHETAITITTLGTFGLNTLAQHVEQGEGEGKLKGLGSSPGKVRGRAKVVIDPNEPIDNMENIILIARETDPGWLFLMLASKGIIVERGSMLSHTAITGRKFGIPTIVSLPHATNIIPDGAMVEMDGGSGVVRILDQDGEGESGT